MSGKKKWIGRLGFFFQPNTMKCTCWLSLCYTNIIFVFIDKKRKLKLPITCENCVVFALYQFFFFFVNIILENVAKNIENMKKKK